MGREDGRALSPTGLDVEGRHSGAGIGDSRSGAGCTAALPLLPKGFGEETAGGVSLRGHFFEPDL